jgi:hypothetical protein
MRDTERVWRLLRARRAAGWQKTTAEESSSKPAGKAGTQGAEGGSDGHHTCHTLVGM